MEVRHLAVKYQIASGNISTIDILACRLLSFSLYMNRFAAKSHKGFTLVEIMIVVAIIALLAAIAVPGFLRARKRSQASRILNDLRMIDSACDQYAIETNRTSGATVNVTDWTNYLKKGSLLYNSGKSLLGSDYGTQQVDTIPTVPANDYATLSDVAGVGFWSPYGP
jgi:prepilin-type N-terminal cleavage/methylation domain-containing protein